MDIMSFYKGNEFEAYEFYGAHITEDGVVFRTYAPNASKVSLTCDLSEWEELPMEQIIDGRSYELTLPEAEDGMRYKYRIYDKNGSFIDHADPYAFGAELRPGTCSVVRSIEGFSFTDLEELIKDLHIFLKAKFIVDAAESSGTEIDEVEMSDIGIDKVELVKDDFIFLADTYKPEKPQSAAFDMNGISELISSLPLKNEENEKPEPISPFALLDDDDDPDVI